MRKWLTAFMMGALVAGGVMTAVAEQAPEEDKSLPPTVEVYVDGKVVTDGVLVDGLVFVPIQDLVEALGIIVKLDTETKKLYIERKPVVDPKAMAAAIDLAKNAKSFEGIAGQAPLVNDKHLADKEMKFRDEPIKVLGWAAEQGPEVFLVSYQYIPTSGKAITVWTTSEPELSKGAAADAPRGWFWEVNAKTKAVTYVNTNAELTKKYKLLRAKSME